ncbi:MAG: nucleoside-diphosphate sugar epimerase/dehydratase [Polyangiales bacterium]
MLAIAFGLSVLIRYDWQVPSLAFRRLAFIMPYVVFLQYAALALFGVTRFSWRYIGLRDVVRIFRPLAAATLALVLIRVVSPNFVGKMPWTRYGVIPYGVIAADFLLAFFGITGVRALRRLLAERADTQSYLRATTGKPIATILVGAGQGGVLVAQEINRRPDLLIEPVGFVDDNPQKIGAVVHGLPVLGAVADLPSLKDEYDIEQALITISSAPGPVIRRIADTCKKSGLDTKIVPGTHQIVDGRVNLSRIRPVAIDDLLRRDPVRLDSDELNTMVERSVVMVTGAGGSIGSELCRQLAALAPKELVLVEQAENALFDVHRELIQYFPTLLVRPCVGDVTDGTRMKSLFSRFSPSIVFHAAAHKHVPMMECNPCEAVKNNVIGTRVVADLAADHGVKKFVMISTDKAVNPTSVMGATKRVAELYIQALSSKSPTDFATVRFGNVLGSTGSVIPIFKEQIERGGPVTVTHPDMKRYFMTIPEACQLVMQAAALSEGSEVYILDMGDPVRIVDLANDLIRLSGLEPDEDIEIEFTGVRPGEKLFEELSVDGESLRKTKHPMIFIGDYGNPGLDALADALSTLLTLTMTDDEAHILAALKMIVPEYQSDARETPCE